MTQTLAAYARLLDSLPEPAFLLKDGALLLANPSGRPLLENGRLPVPLALFARDGKAGGCTLFGRSFSVETAALPPYSLLLLQKAPAEAFLDVRELSRLAEQLRFPMSATLSATQLLAESMEPGGGQAEHYLKAINQNHYRLLRLIGNLAEYCRLNTPEFSLPLQPTDLSALVRDTAREAQALVSLAGLTLHYDKEGAPLVTLGNPDALRRLILQLLSNAIKHTPRGGEISVRLHQAADEAFLSVTDSGEAPQDLRNIFARFRSESPLNDPTAGEGLGLPLVRRIAALHGGSVALAPRASGGTRVTVLLPIRADGPTVLGGGRPVDYDGGFSRVLLELSDALPPEAFSAKDLE